MAPHLETIDVPDGVEDAAADALDHAFVVDRLAWGLRPMVELLADYHDNPAMDELVGPARHLRERLDDLLEAGDAARLRGARRTPRHLLALARFARRTVVPSFATMADVPPITGAAAVDAMRDELGALIAPQGGATAGMLPTCEELLACAPPDRASWQRVATALLADDAADRVLRHSGVCVVSDVLDDLVDDLQTREDPPLELLAFVDAQRDEVSRAHAFAWLAAHRRAFEVTERRLGRLGHRARDLESLRHAVGLTLHEAAFPTSLELLAHLAVFVDDALGIE
jgi:hypothetical protein